MNNTDTLELSQSNREVAQDLAARGFEVFPIRPNEAGDWTPIKGWQDRASIDLDVIGAWWSQWPDARVGLICGERTGITVLDVDRKEGKDGLATLRGLGFDPFKMSPVITKTPSGGLHLFFGFDPRLKNWAGKLGIALDTRNTGGYVVAPGSWKAGLQYEPIGAPLGSVDLPAFPEALIPPPEPEREPAELVAHATDEQRTWAADMLARKAYDLELAEEGGRNALLNSHAMWAGGAAAHGFLSEDAARAALADACRKCGMSDREFRATFRSGFKGGMRKPITDYPRTWTEDDFEDLPSRSTYDEDLLELLGEASTPAQTGSPVAVGQGSIMRNDQGGTLATLHNAILYLSEVNRRRDLRIRFNQFTGRDEWISGLIGDADAGLIRVAIEQAGMRNVGSDLTAQAIRAVAQLNAYHPVQDWLNSLPPHDGVPRIDSWLSTYLGAAASP